MEHYVTANAYENNGGGLTLVVRNANGVHAYTGLEYPQNPGILWDMLTQLIRDPMFNDDWDEDESLSADDVQSIMDGDDLIAELDRNGDLHLYIDRMGAAGRVALNLPEFS